MGIFSKPKVPNVPPPPFTPTRADTVQPVDTGPVGAESLISTGSTGLSRKPETKKRSLIGG